MIGALLKQLQTLDYLLLTVKASENRLSTSSKFVYSQIQNLYAEDISERVVGMFTFLDDGKLGAYEAVKEAGIPMKEKNQFGFNNSAIFSKGAEGKTTRHFWTLGMGSYERFVQFIKTENKKPVSLSLTS